MKHKWQLIEWGKTLGIVVLSITALILAAKAYFLPSLVNDASFSWGGNWSSSGGNGNSMQSGIQMASSPVRIVVTSSSGRRCVQYGTAETEGLFGQIGGFLGEVLSSAGMPEKISEKAFQEALEKEGCFFEWIEAIPMSALCGWLNGGVENEKLPHFAKRLLVGEREDGTLCLYYINADDGLYYACRTGEIEKEQLEQAVTGYLPNGAQFAFETEWKNSIDPYFVLMDGTTSLPILESKNPLETEEALDELFTTMGLNYNTMSSYQVENGMVFKQENDTVRLTQNGKLTYTGKALEQFPVSCEDAVPTQLEVIEAARQLVSQLTEPFCGELVRFYLAEVEQIENGVYEVRFGCQVEGAPIFLSTGEYAAEIKVEKATISSFSLYIRNYSFSGTRKMLLPLNQVIASVSERSTQRISLLRGYIDNGENGTMVADWMTQQPLRNE